jgi:hypothetical protein
MMGRWTPLEEIDERLALKVGKIITQVRAAAIKKLGKTRRAVREQIYQSLKIGRTYQLDPNKMFVPKRPRTLLEEYGFQ